MAPKKIGQSSIIGEKGIAVIRRIVLEMGFMFYETGGVEAGIDGFIELRDEASGQVGNLLLQIQGKATERQFPRESSDSRLSGLVTKMTSHTGCTEQLP